MAVSNPQAARIDEPVLSDAFKKAVVPASARFWAAHFSHHDVRPCIQAIFCYAHMMDQLAVASPEIIREKSLWWHEELQRFRARDSRHPILKTLLNLGQHLLADALHEHLHGALSTQQKIAISDRGKWRQYAQLRLGSLHTLLGLSAGLPADKATAFGTWAGELGMNAVSRAPDLFADGRWTIPVSDAIVPDADTSAAEHLQNLLDQRPGPGATASEVLIAHDLHWWQRDATCASPLYSNAPTGLRGMLRSWRAARATPYA